MSLLNMHTAKNTPAERRDSLSDSEQRCKVKELKLTRRQVKVHLSSRLKNANSTNVTESAADTHYFQNGDTDRSLTWRQKSTSASQLLALGHFLKSKS